MQPPMSNCSMRYRELLKCETYDMRVILQGASCTMARVTLPADAREFMALSLPRTTSKIEHKLF
jgi:hypothetical protein